MSYTLYALDWTDSATVYYSIVLENGTEEAKVVEKYPSDEDMLDIDSFWWPNFQTRNYLLLKDHLVRTTLAVSFIGILLLAVISSIPVWLCSDWRSLSLYIPAAAAVLCIANENCQTGGWRCDAIFLIPAYAVIVVAWLFRVIHVAQK